MNEELNRDEFEEYDGAYVLGALSEDERDAFEAHLATCAACRDRVAELSDVPDLLALVAASAYTEPPQPLIDPIVALLDEIRARRRRRRWIVATASTVAAACLITVTAIIAHNPSSKPVPVAQQEAMTAVTAAPIHATIEVTDVAWGTSIRLHCTYDEGQIYPAGEEYSLVVQSRTGQIDDLGTWKLVPGKVTTFPAGTAFHKSDIKTITVDTANGAPLLQLSL